MNVNENQRIAFDLFENTNEHLFITGKAGTGKTTFLKKLLNESRKKDKIIVVAPTGIAALNAGGATIHSTFQLPFGVLEPVEAKKTFESIGQQSSWYDKNNMKKEKIDLLNAIEVIIIDEISMVRCDILDAIHSVLCKIRRSNEPFGGCQIVMIGDPNQLPPVVNSEDKKKLMNFYDSYFFFDSLILSKVNYFKVEFNHIYRQADPVFINILNEFRTSEISKKSLDIINKRSKVKGDDTCIHLCTHKSIVSNINSERLKPLKDKKTYKGTVTGKFSSNESSLPTDLNLELANGARVMFCKNDTSEKKMFVNGTLGTIVKINQTSIDVIIDGEQDPINITQQSWREIEYVTNALGEIEENELGRFNQLPVKLAWAITVHKSQGLTFDKVILDISKAFDHGQAYVALSRCRSLEGLFLKEKITPDCAISNSDVKHFFQHIEDNPLTTEILEEVKKKHLYENLKYVIDNDFFKKEIHNFSSIAKNLLISDSIREKIDDLEEMINAVCDIKDNSLQLVTLLIKQDIFNSDPEKFTTRISGMLSYFDEKLTIIYNALKDINTSSLYTQQHIIDALMHKIGEKIYVVRNSDINNLLESMSIARKKINGNSNAVLKLMQNKEEVVVEKELDIDDFVDLPF